MTADSTRLDSTQCIYTDMKIVYKHMATEPAVQAKEEVK